MDETDWFQGLGHSYWINERDARDIREAAKLKLRLFFSRTLIIVARGGTSSLITLFTVNLPAAGWRRHYSLVARWCAQTAADGAKGGGTPHLARGSLLSCASVSIVSDRLATANSVVRSPHPQVSLASEDFRKLRHHDCWGKARTRLLGSERGEIALKLCKH